MLPSLERPPDAVWILTHSGHPPIVAFSTGADRLVWEGGGVRVGLQPQAGGFTVLLEAPGVSLRRVWLRWNQMFAQDVRLLGDAWERSYGDLEWRGASLPRPMPWYFLAAHPTDGTAGYGVQTGCATLACWHADAEGITLELDARCGGEGVLLGNRTLVAATILQCAPRAGESPFSAARAFCRALCPVPRMPREPVVGHNDWYWLYGHNSRELILAATRRLLGLCDFPVRPWSVIDDGWQASAGPGKGVCNGGPWGRSNAHFPEMAGLANEIKELGARPGIWMRPLLTNEAVPPSWLLQRPGSGIGASRGHTLDPSVPEVLERVREDVAGLAGWGYELIKHDFTTFDLTGRWGFEMVPAAGGFAVDGWSFAATSRTTAEIILELYSTIREAAGPDTVLIGCNTVGHLAAGLVEIQRTGDDTSAQDWDRTRRMGVNTLAFRAAQHGAFYAVDADCVPVSPHIPEHLTAAWLELVARSGTPLFVSIDPLAHSTGGSADLRRALRLAAAGSALGEPLDWIETPFPQRWRLDHRGQRSEVHFEWTDRTAFAEEAV